jgi:hypothetical protein
MMVSRTSIQTRTKAEKHLDCVGPTLRRAGEFEQRVRREAKEYGLELVEFEGAETLDDRLAMYEVSDGLTALAESIRDSDKMFRYF